MSSVDARAAIGTLFDTGWADATPIAWPNKDFSPPSDSDWVKFDVVETDTFQHEIGGPKRQHREVGLIIVKVFTPRDVGDGPARTYADTIAAIFRDQVVSYTDGRAIFRSPQVRVIGPDAETDEKAVWFQVNVSVPYVRDTLF